MPARLLLLLILPLAACGGSDAQCVIDTDCPLFNRCSAQQCVPVGVSDASVDTIAPADASPDTTVADTAVDTGVPIVGRGNVGLSQTPLPSMMATHAMSASFLEEGATSSCTTTESAPCSITECVTAPPMDGGVPDAATGDAGMPSAPSAGTVSASGGLMDLSVVPGADGLYPPASGTGFIYSGGETLNVTAAGDDVPAFAQSVTAPFPVDVTDPSFLAGSLTIDRTADLSVTWTTMEPAPGDVVVTLTGFEMPMGGGTRSVSVSCTYDGAAASGDISPTTLMNLPGGGATGSFSVATRSSAEITAGGWIVTISATNGARGDTGGAATASVTYP